MVIDGIHVRYWREGPGWNVHLYSGPEHSAVLLHYFWTQGKEQEAIADARQEVVKIKARRAASA
jgi:hypothetical protein